MRFAVHGPGSPSPPRAVTACPAAMSDGRVHVSVAGVSAGSRTRSRLALARPRIHVPARRASLTSKSGIDPLDPAGRFLLQTDVPADPNQNARAPIQHGFLATSPAWVRHRALSGSGHVLHPEILDLDRVEAARDVRAAFSTRSLRRSVSRALICAIAGAPVHGVWSRAGRERAYVPVAAAWPAPAC